MSKELDPIESLKFKHVVTGLLLTYVERAKTKQNKKAATKSINDRFTNSTSPKCSQSLATSTSREGYFDAEKKGPLMTDLQISRPLNAHSPWQPAHPEKAILLLPGLLMTDLQIPRPLIYSPWQTALFCSVCPATGKPWYQLAYQQF
ncbi:hypothetical protein PoB_006743300 [Plakobranchus ocellatus]|uniref:Uncharacterized protein n=1 Tax=Plakobranchus ocellatus TaxID=259542 RepID=A0AAV4DA48_9GAST|nr:hypothetical protein PoB_006743300 [Plakobranchus ocellatus]